MLCCPLCKEVGRQGGFVNGQTRSEVASSVIEGWNELEKKLGIAV